MNLDSKIILHPHRDSTEQHLFKFQVIVMFFALTACAQSTEGRKETDLKFDLQIDENVKKLIVLGFDEYGEQAYFTAEDSCVFMKYIDEDWKIDPKKSTYRVFENLSILTNSCPYTKFSFVILKDINTFHYYGHADIYHLRYSAKASQSLIKRKIYEFPNKSLETLLNNTVVQQFTGDWNKDRETLESFLYYLYFENVFKTNTPVFLKKRHIGNVLSDYTSPENEVIINEEFSTIKNEDFVVFENENIGVVIFSFKRTSTRKISLKQYIILSSNAEMLLRPDVLPEKYRMCILKY